MLALTDFRKSYDGRTVLAIADLQLPAGAWWLQGPNGAGKSTLLRCIAGLTPYEGSIRCNGLELRHARMEYCRAVSWAEAEPQYPPFLSGDDLIAFYCNTRGGSATEAKALLDALGAHGYLHRQVGTWSSGMLKKLSLALAFLGSPRLLLLDEPLITLDAAAQEACTELITGALAAGASFVITSHQPLPGLALQQLLLRDQTVQPL